MAELKKAVFQLRALTPVWTGNANQECDRRILETSVLGSLRWWLEACARAFGVPAPDPVTSQPQFDKDHKDSLNPVSRVFEATDWRRVFRLTVEGGTIEALPPKIVIPTELHRNPRWRPNQRGKQPEPEKIGTSTKNVFEVDGSSFVTSGPQNPTMTILALSMRASEYVAEQLRTRALG